jgi:hypothetical protein
MSVDHAPFRSTKGDARICRVVVGLKGSGSIARLLKPLGWNRSGVAVILLSYTQSIFLTRN